MSDWTYTNWYATRLHQFGETHQNFYGEPYNTAACGAVVESYALVEARRTRSGYKTKHAPDLPRCKKCARTAAT